MPDFPFQIERTIVIGARPSTVFSFFSNNDLWATWWGAGSTIEPHAGGKVYIRHPNGVETLGHILEISNPDRIVFTYGYPTGTPISLDGSRVTIHLQPHSQGTQLNLLHEFREPISAEQHIQGWRFQLSRFSNAVANLVHANCGTTIDQWFEAWAIRDAEARTQALNTIALPTIQFRDQFSCLQGIDDLSAHIGAYHRFMPQLALQRAGPVSHCQGVALVQWIDAGSTQPTRMSGTSVFQLDPEGQVCSVTSFATPQAVN